MSRQDDILMAYMSRWCMWLWTGAARVSCRERRKSHLITSTTHNFFSPSHIYSYLVYLDGFPKNTLCQRPRWIFHRLEERRLTFFFEELFSLPSPNSHPSLRSPPYFFFKAVKVGSIFVLPSERAVQPLEEISPWINDFHNSRIQHPPVGAKRTEWPGVSFPSRKYIIG